MILSCLRHEQAIQYIFCYLHWELQDAAIDPSVLELTETLLQAMGHLVNLPYVPVLTLGPVEAME